MNNRNKKAITVRFFSVKSKSNFFDDFIAIQNADIDRKVRIINIREKKHFIKIHGSESHSNKEYYFLSVVRERNTWQAKALGDGTISGITLNQGIVGDLYYFLIVPDENLIAGFTTGLSGSLRGVAVATLQQFNRDRTKNVNLEHISRKNEIGKLKQLNGYNKLHFKVNFTQLGELNEESPSMLRQLSIAPFLTNNSHISLTLTDIGNERFTEKDLEEIVNFLSENDGCTTLTVYGLDAEGEKVHLDFSNTYKQYKKEIETRDKYIDEKIAKEVLLESLLFYRSA